MNFSVFLQNPFLTALLIVVITWLLNEWGKRHHENYIRKEQRYSALLKSLRGFYIESQDKELKEKFLNEVNQCWLYCPDRVIEKAYAFLNKVHTDNKFNGAGKEIALGELILEIRKDLYVQFPFKRTNLKAEDFKNLRST